MIELHWYFWVVAFLTLVSMLHDGAQTLRYARQENGSMPVFGPTVIGLLWCVHHVWDAVCS